MPDVLPCGRHYHFTGEVYSGRSFMGVNMNDHMEQARDLEKTVLFIDEFEEIAGSRDNASRIEKSITHVTMICL
jgi:hypothetical protein